MDDTTTLGAYLRAERERRELTLRTISESTKVSLPLLEGLESDDISRWPGGIFRQGLRALVRRGGRTGSRRRLQSASSGSTNPLCPTWPVSTPDIPLPKSSRLRRPPGSTARWCRVEPGAVSRHRGGHGRRAGARLWQRSRRFAASVAGPPDCCVLRGWRPAHRDQPDGGPPRRVVTVRASNRLGSAGRTVGPPRTSTRCWVTPRPEPFLPDVGRSCRRCPLARLSPAATYSHAQPGLGVGSATSASWMVNRLQSSPWGKRGGTDL